MSVQLKAGDVSFSTGLVLKNRLVPMINEAFQGESKSRRWGRGLGGLMKELLKHTGRDVMNDWLRVILGHGTAWNWG